MQTREENTMKIAEIVAIAVVLLGTGQFALAQTTRDMGANTGSQANRQEHQQGGVYTGNGQ
jgi:hypothetical protein